MNLSELPKPQRSPLIVVRKTFHPEFDDIDYARIFTQVYVLTCQTYILDAIGIDHFVHILVGHMNTPLIIELIR